MELVACKRELRGSGEAQHERSQKKTSTVKFSEAYRAIAKRGQKEDERVVGLGGLLLRLSNAKNKRDRRARKGEGIVKAFFSKRRVQVHKARVSLCFCSSLTLLVHDRAAIHSLNTSRQQNSPMNIASAWKGKAKRKRSATELFSFCSL
jgi:hypothetical protein